MATKLCCTADQDNRSGSPELPNARVSQPTPANRPLLPKDAGSPSSRFTSARSEDLHELQEIFHNARDSDEDRAMPMRALRARFSRPSMQSVRSLHKMTSMRSLIRRRFSKELPKKASGASLTQVQPKQKSITSISDTVVEQLKHGPNEQLQITKDDLRKDLLSDKKPEEGGYDSDAEVLDDIAKNIGKKSPSKRPSIHSVDWTTTTGSRRTAESSTKARTSVELKRDLSPYSINPPQAASLSSRFSQVFSTPNLRTSSSGERDQRVRRSHSATSMGLPKPSPVSPLRLPSLTNIDSADVSWSEVMHKSLRLSHFPVPPRHLSPDASTTKLNSDGDSKDDHGRHQKQNSTASASSRKVMDKTAISSARMVEIRVQQPTSVASPRPSTSIRGAPRERSPSRKVRQTEEGIADDEDDNPRRSVHLYSMRISHHLRSGSLLSWDQLADAPDLPTSPRVFRERTPSDQSQTSPRNRQLARHDRQTSSSGFASTKVPSKWGNVLPHDVDARPDVASSIYSSRPQSPPDSYGGSMVTLSRTRTENETFSIKSSDLRRPRRSASFPTDNEDTPRPAKRHGLTDLATVTGHAIESSLLAVQVPLARKNSVADTKTSKFREEFSPSPPKKKLSQSVSIVKFLNPKRLSGRSQSEANLQLEASVAAMDGPSDTLAIPAGCERGHSRSLTSFQTEQDALGKNKGANHVWDRALQAHQEEKASLFLPKNKDLAVHANPFRERSGSVSVRRASVEGLDPASRADDGSSTRVSTLCPTLQTPSEEPSEGLYPLVSRRSALVGRDDVSVGQEVSTAFERQGDNTDIVGAWGRYPSHTRHDRTASAGKADNVQPRDFALEAAIKFASATDDDDMIDPTERRPSTPLLPGERKKKKKVGSGSVAKSNSMTFGKTLMKNYAKMFRSQSTEFQRHGRGHRSSIASGGILEHPELELLPHVWTGDVHRGNTDTQASGDEHPVLNQDPLIRVNGSKGSLRADDSMATLRPRRNSSAPNLNEMLFRDGAADSEHARDRARVWSVYYENCVDTYPRLSAETSRVLEDFGHPNRLSLDSRCASMRSRAMPIHLPMHTRKASHMSQLSNGSHVSNFVSKEENNRACDERSLVSVRRSTMDLISRFKEQEATEHERILSFSRMDSGRARESVAAL